MKVLSNIVNLSVVATLLLQSGHFVNATPLFNVAPGGNHLNDASLENVCDSLKITYPLPTKTDLEYEDASKHVIAWKASDAITNLNITMVDSNNAANSIYVGTFAASLGATEELPINLDGHEAGEYHYHISGQSGDQTCEVDSVNFKITKREEPTVTQEPTAANTITPAATEATTTADTTSTHLNEEEISNIIQNIHSKTAPESNHNDDDGWASALDQVSSYTKDTTNEKEPSNAHIDAMIQELENVHATSHSNDASSDEKVAPSSTSFKDYINNLDQDYKKYIHKNKETEEEVVTHKNDASDPYFTNEDHTNQHNNDAYFTNEDRTTTHANAANPFFTNEDHTNQHNNDAYFTNEDHTNQHNNDAYFTNEDRTTTHANAANPYFTNEDHTNHVNEVNTWHSNDYFTNEDRTASGHANDAEWEEAEEEHSNSWNGDGAHVNAPVANDNAWEEEGHQNGWTGDGAHSNAHVDEIQWEDDDSHENAWTGDGAHTNAHVDEIQWEEAHDNASGWHVNEVDVEVETPHENGVWVDDHVNSLESNDDAWHTNEIDVEVETNDHSNDVPTWSDVTEDHNNAIDDDSEWHSNEIDIEEEPETHNDATWVDDAHVNGLDSDDSEWHSNEIDVEDYHATDHNNGWEESVGHNDDGEWHSNEIDIEEEPETHNDATWVDDAHVNGLDSDDSEWHSNEIDVEDQHATEHNNGWEESVGHNDGW
ncbi:hypothetical protein K501DRAFT_8835 [Backusella circina FSU 941]|nr:hypothetical protein K501DRAFT_8835 [Backusella circina FSU 941]